MVKGKIVNRTTLLNRLYRNRRITVAIMILSLFIPAGSLSGQTGQDQNDSIDMDLSISARECYTGESLTLQALVSGTDQVEVGTLPDPEWGTITYLGGQRRNSQSITNINGKFTRIEEKGFLMSFQITPGKTGEFTVPEMTFNAGGALLRTTPFTIRSKAPEKSDDYVMEISAGTSKIYPGQEFVIDVKWYYRNGARSLSFSLPFLDEFEYLGQVPVKGRAYELVMNNTTVQASGEEGYCETFGESATFLAFSLLLKAETPGTWDLREAASSFEGVTGTETVRDFFGNKQVQEKYSRLVISGSGDDQTALLEVKPIPAPPAGWNTDSRGTGRLILGPASVTAELSKTEISVGEPVTLTLTFSLAANSDFSIPPLEDQEGLGTAGDFSIPPERSPGKNEGENRTFVQTIRAKNNSPAVFPSLRFAVFNTDYGEWEMISTEPIPITVLPTKVADSGDLEVWEDDGPVVRDLERNESGLLASYTGSGLLDRQRPGFYPGISPGLYYILLILPALIWLILYLYRKQFFGRRRSGTAEFRRFLKKWKNEELPLRDFEEALASFMKAETETETGIRGMGIYGYEKHLESAPAAAEIYTGLKSEIDRELYSKPADSQEKQESPGLSDEKRSGLGEEGEKLLKEMLK